jgi:serine/threonine protein phosphatase PrpC
MTAEREVGWRCGAASDAGLVRARNEDRYWIDERIGAYLVVDGMGGHAGGELAAETAVAAIRDALAAGRGAAAERVRDAITRANNAIYALAENGEGLRGMACVLTLALVEDGQMTIGHVGDSRLYVVWNGAIRKLTSDHSPVGELEDAGLLSQEQAMRHPQRNEVFRDVGSRPREGSERDFIEVRACQCKPDAAFLLCSDGLSDLLTSAQIKEVVERYRGDADAVAADLVAAANQAGGRDNITAILVAGPAFRGGACSDTAEMPAHKRMRLTGRSLLSGRAAFLVYGLLIGMLVWVVLHIQRG